MLNIIWLMMIVIAVLVGLIEGRLDKVVESVTVSAQVAFNLALSLAGVFSLWLGIMSIAAESGLVQRLAKFLNPLLRFLFPDIPKDHPAMGAIVMNITANVLGLANAATPFGLKAMQELQLLNPYKTVASNDMCTFLAINTSSVQIIPATAIAYLAASGALHPTQIIFSSLLATTVSTVVALISVRYLAKLKMYALKMDDAI